jgi:hypothetical protein
VHLSFEFLDAFVVIERPMIRRVKVCLDGILEDSSFLRRNCALAEEFATMPMAWILCLVGYSSDMWFWFLWPPIAVYS